MKNIYKKIGFIFSLTLVILWACEEEYEAPTAEPNHVYVTTSFGNLTARLQVNGRMTFLDLSRGVESRTWTFPANTVDTALVPISSSTEDIIRVIYTQPGRYNVQCSQKYVSDVYLGKNLTGSSRYDTTIVVTVLDSIRAAFDAVRVLDGSVLANSDDALNVIEGGREITFTHKCTGEPTSLRWIFSKDDGFTREITGETVTTKLNSVGKYDLTLIASSDFGADTISYVDYIEIVPSTDPMILESVTAAKQIRLAYSRDLEYPGTCDPTSISLTITNEGDLVEGITVTGFELDQTLSNIVVLTLSEEIYNTDKILISYDDQIGNLVSADGMKIDSFTDEEVVFTSRRDLFVETGYDGTVENSTSSNWSYAYWGGIWAMYNANDNVSTTQAYEGNQSLYFDIQAGGGAVLNFEDNAGTTLNTVPVEEGKIYESSMWVYIEEQGSGASNILWMLPSHGWASMLGVYLNGSETTGEWFKVTMRYEATATEDMNFVIRGNNPESTVPLKVYIDNMKFEELEKRP